MDIDFEKFRSYTKIYLTGDQVHDKNVLKELPVLMDRLLANNDIKNGICVFLTSRTRYQDLVTALDLANQYQTLGVVPYYNRIFIFKLAYDSRSLMAATGKSLVFDDLIFIRERETFFETIKKALENITPFWPISVPFAGMIYFWKRRRIKKKVIIST